MKTQKQMTTVALAKAPSDETASPPQHSYVAFQREELLAVLAARPPLNDTHSELQAGIENASPGSEVIVMREHILTAFGVDWETFDREQAEAKAKAEEEAKAQAAAAIAAAAEPAKESPTPAAAPAFKSSTEPKPDEPRKGTDNKVS